ncbi:hypothetical protein VTK26DRAFT_8750 [Humicola hyalothermophila]
MARSRLSLALRRTLLCPSSVALRSLRQPVYPISPFYNNLDGPSLPQLWQHRNELTMATSSTRRSEPFSVGSALRGDSGRSYEVQEILAERRKPLLFYSEGYDRGGVRLSIVPADTPCLSCPNIRVLVDNYSR